jgi:hypothetical protein
MTSKFMALNFYGQRSPMLADGHFSQASRQRSAMKVKQTTPPRTPLWINWQRFLMVNLIQTVETIKPVRYSGAHGLVRGWLMRA